MQIVVIRDVGGVRFEMTVRSLDGATNTLFAEPAIDARGVFEVAADAAAETLAAKAASHAESR